MRIVEGRTDVCFSDLVVSSQVSLAIINERAKHRREVVGRADLPFEPVGRAMVADMHVAKLGVQRRRRYRRKLDTSMQTVAIRLQVVSATCIQLEMDILGNTAETQLRLTKHITHPDRTRVV